MLRKPFSPPPKTGRELDISGWEALYTKPFEKEVEVKSRNRIHNEMIRQAEEAKDKEKPHLPLENVQNALIFKRMRSHRQLLGSLL